MSSFDLIAACAETIEGLYGLSLFEADQVLDEARRLAWARRFAGDDWETLESRLSPSERGLKLGKFFAPLSLSQVEQVLFNVRFNLWSGRFMAVPNSVFAQEFNNFLERENFAAKATMQSGKRKRGAGPALSVVLGGRVN